MTKKRIVRNKQMLFLGALICLMRNGIIDPEPIVVVVVAVKGLVSLSACLDTRAQSNESLSPSFQL